MRTNKDIRVEGSNLIINGEKHSLNPAIDDLIKRANTVQGKLSALNTKITAIEALEKSASGNPISITGAAKAYVMSLSMTIEPIQSGSGDPSPTNVRPISGISEAVVTRTGKNVLPVTLDGIKAVNISGTWSGNTYTFNGVTFKVNADVNGGIESIEVNGTASANTTIQLLNPITQTLDDLLLTEGTTYTLTGCPSGGGNSTYLLNFQSWGAGQDIADYGSGKTSVLSGYNRRFCIYVAQNVTANNLVFKPQLELGSTATDYEPYTAANATITFGQTVYGGSVNFKTGEVTVTHANIASYNGESINEPWLSSLDKYESGATPTTGAQVVYPLTTPTTLTLTPAELELLKGNNTITANGAEISIEYLGR